MNPEELAANLQTNFINQIKDYAIFAMDPQGIVITWNKGAERLKGYPEEEIVGQYYGMLFPDAYQQAGKPAQELNLAVEHGVYEAQDWRKRQDGSHFWADVTLTPIYADGGQHIGFTKVTGDVSKQKQMQDQLAERHNVLKDKNSELQKINLDLDNFVYTASHDLRTPISNIEGLVTTVKEELKESNCLSSEMETMLQHAMTSVERFKRTLGDLTQVSKFQKEATEKLAEEIINIQEVYEDIIADMDYPFDQKTTFIKIDLQVHQLKFSRKNFRSILYNLLSNALKYQDAERDCIVTLETRLKEEYVVLTVEDNGSGLGKKQQEKLYTIFQRFYSHVEGTGIGLYMVKRIIENAGGKIELESEQGKGAKFEVYFPASL